MKTLRIADLFCGAGGTSTGATQAAEALGYQVELTAVNHWEIAVQTHSSNHPRARHLCASIDSLNPRSLYAEGALDILLASPECTHHSRARGGRPMLDQSRATAWCVTRWAEALRPRMILVENVPEFQEWGPLGADSKPLIGRRGETFLAWIRTLESIGYRVEWRILCAANYGDPTTRHRLFVQAVRGRRRIVWPEPTHVQTKGLFGEPIWRGAREIIDWTLPGQSIFSRKRPLAAKTMERIWRGLRQFGIEPLIVTLHGTSDSHIRNSSRRTDEPLRTISAGGGHHALIEPFLIPTAHSGPRKTHNVDAPLPTVCGNRGDLALIEPCLLPQQSDGRLRPVSEPAPTVAAAGAIALVEPFLVSYYGNGGIVPIDDPVPTVTTKDRFGLVLPVVTIDGEQHLLDIRFRMLTAGELAAAQGFPTGYRFAGNKTQQIKQIGNAVPCGFARALVGAALREKLQVAREEAA